jgi:hypothetical protein
MSGDPLLDALGAVAILAERSVPVDLAAGAAEALVSAAGALRLVCRCLPPLARSIAAHSQHVACPFVASDKAHHHGPSHGLHPSPRNPSHRFHLSSRIHRMACIHHLEIHRIRIRQHVASHRSNGASKSITSNSSPRIRGSASSTSEFDVMTPITSSGTLHSSP